ncbi:hypothetical protein D3C87_1862570 [compost metagenome]
MELHNRVEDFLIDLTSKEINQPIVVVCHAGTIRSILCHHSSLPLKDAFQNKVDFGEVIKIEL